VLGYTGTIHPDRLDVGLTRRIAEAWPGTVALIGPSHLDDRHRDLTGRDNVKLTGPVAYRDIPRWMDRIDVLMVPHVVSAFTESLNPIKLWEYLASGLPIVSTPVAGFRDYAEHVRLASEAEAFVAAAREAMHEPAERRERRRAIARGHAWSDRVATIDRILRGQAESPIVVSVSGGERAA
jgi:glycosyltransferase involved in cell wall biosynthesis